MQAFADAYHAAGPPEDLVIDVNELALHFRLMNMVKTEEMLSQVMPWLSEDGPHGRLFWKDVKTYNDEQILQDFGFKVGLSVLYNKIVLWSKRGDTYWAEFEKWAERVKPA